MTLHDELRTTRDDLRQYIERELDWDVMEVRVDQDDRYEDEPIELRVRVEARKEIERDNEFKL